MQSPRRVPSNVGIGRGGACRRAAPAQDLRARLLAAGELTGTTSRDVWKPYWAAQQRFFKLLCISMKARRGAAARRLATPTWSPPASCSSAARSWHLWRSHCSWFCIASCAGRLPPVRPHSASTGLPATNWCRIGRPHLARTRNGHNMRKRNAKLVRRWKALLSDP